MLTLTHVPNQIYLVALDHMGVERPADPTQAQTTYESAESRVDYRPVSAQQDGHEVGRLHAFAFALGLYLSLSGPFAEDDGEFAGLNGYSIT